MTAIQIDDTIAAIATPIGEGGVSVIRLSGPNTFKIISKIFKPRHNRLQDFHTHTIHVGHIANDDEEVIDQVLVSVFKEPHSYTGEDVAEISSHGGFVVTRLILDLIIQKGVRHAEPGEFTKRAFLNGKN